MISVLLEDSSLAIWELYVDDAGILHTTASAGASVSLLLNDTGGNSWQVGVDTLGGLTTTPVAHGAYPPFLLLISLGNVSWWMSVATTGTLVTTSISPFPPVAPVYTYATFGQVKQAVADRLYDSAMTFWTSAELGLYIVEALRTWNALTGFWRDDFLFSPSQGVTWYDITDQTVMPNTLRPITLTDRDLYSLIQYHLLEPIQWQPWAGASKQFADTDLVGAVQRRRDELLSATSCSQLRRLVPAVNGRIFLPDTVIDVRRMAYLPAIGAPSVMWPEDAWGETSFEPRYLQNPPGTPLTYLLSTEPPISFETNCPPIAAGSYELLTVEAGPLLTVNVAETLTVPDDWAWVIKWGAMADLLSRDANARDANRAAYCEQRYRMGMAALTAAPALLAARINNVATNVDAVRGGDLYDTSWEGAPQGPPTKMFHSGLNLVALGPSPDSGTYSVTLTVVENAPVPVADGDNVQVSRDDLDAIIDMAQHTAAFKMGGAEFAATMPLLQRFLKQATLYNRKLTEIAEFKTALYSVSQLEKSENPVMAPAGDGDSDAGEVDE